MQRAHGKSAHSSTAPETDTIRSLRNLVPFVTMAFQTTPWLLSVAIVLRLIRAAIPLATLWISKLILDAVVRSIVSHQAKPQIWKFVFIDIALTILSDYLDRGNAALDGIVSDQLALKLGTSVIEHATRLDYEYFEDGAFLDMLTRARQQSTGRTGVVAMSLNCLQDILSLSLLSSGLVLYSPWLLLLLLGAVIPVFYGETKLIATEYSLLRRRTPDSRRLDYFRFLGASAQSAKEVRVFGLGSHLAKIYHSESRKLIDENRRVSIHSAWVSFALSLIATGGSYAGYGLMLFRVISGQISVGSFTFLTRTFFRAEIHVQRIFNSLRSLSEQAVQLESLFSFLQTPCRLRMDSCAQIVTLPLDSGFELCNVGFRYPGSVEWAIRNVNLAIATSEIVAIVGPNGSGKTTLIKLLCRLYDPTEGYILLNGIDIRKYQIDEFQRQIGVIFQDYMRYDLSIKDNICFGDIRSLSNMTRIETVARKSMALRIVNSFAGRYEQIVGRRFEGGADLSGGEWQRLALARAYMKESAIVILDEPTASLDARAEQEIVRRFIDSRGSQMSIIISHKLSTVRAADRIIVIANGMVQEEGTHAELMVLGGKYAKLFEIQAAAYR
jgi:ATP-binding cassette, subfamily B, bacterial